MQTFLLNVFLFITIMSSMACLFLFAYELSPDRIPYLKRMIPKRWLSLLIWGVLAIGLFIVYELKLPLVSPPATPPHQTPARASRLEERKP